MNLDDKDLFNEVVFTNELQGIMNINAGGALKNRNFLYNTAGNFETQAGSVQQYGIFNFAPENSQDSDQGFFNDGTFVNGKRGEIIKHGAWFTNHGMVHQGKDAVITNYARLDNTGAIFNNQQGSEINLQQKGTLYNTGTIWSKGTIKIAAEGWLYNAYGATISLLDDWGAGGPSGSPVGAFLLEHQGRFTNKGSFYGDFTNYGAIDGTGNITGDVVDHGTMAVGNSTGAKTIVGNYFKVDGSKHVELDGLFDGGGDQSLTEYDFLDVTGNVELGGVLDLEVLAGFELHRGNSFNILRVGGTLTGQFDGLGEGDLVGNFGGQDVFISYVAGDGNDVGLFTNAVPEPTTALVWSLLAGLGLTVRRRR
ncbi:MAG: PEP-CTERM sorting domain-containing protein [Mariniblastus sp.]|nr:PEP-CTERM sorting domain-containing protein [Mariniblastus sp.]